jgi:hypothetical protein
MSLGSPVPESAADLHNPLTKHAQIRSGSASGRLMDDEATADGNEQHTLLATTIIVETITADSRHLILNTFNTNSQLTTHRYLPKPRIELIECCQPGAQAEFKRGMQQHLPILGTQRSRVPSEIDICSISFYPQAEALVQRAQQMILDVEGVQQDDFETGVDHHLA